METKKDKCQYIEMCRFIGSIMILCHHSYTLMERTFFIGGWAFVEFYFILTGYYTTLHGDHPIILSFESLIYIILCNSGLIGVLLWAFLIFKIMRRNSIFVKETKVLLNTLLFFYLAYSCITGEYGYMQLYIIFYVLMQGEALLNSNKL